MRGSLWDADHGPGGRAGIVVLYFPDKTIAADRLPALADVLLNRLGAFLAPTVPLFLKKKYPRSLS